MKTINETFTDSEIKSLQKRKQDESWHDFILKLSADEEEIFEWLHNQIKTKEASK